MSQKNNENTMSKLRQFFRIKSSSGAGRDKTDIELLRELEEILQPKIPVAQRCKVLKELCEGDKINKLEDATIQKLWELTKDLIVSNKPTEQRHIAFAFYQKLIQSQYEDVSLMREHFFNVIQNHNVPEDIYNRLELLKTLTDNGKNLKNVDDSIGEFMLQWMPAIKEANLTQPFLQIIVNIITYNAAYLDTRILIEMINYACSICCSMEDTKTVLQCLHVLDAALCYTVFPMETLSACIAALCRTVNKETYCQMSWKIMKNLLGTNLGHEALLIMCNILKNSVMYDEALLRGAVFYINMGLWGSTGSVVPMLKCSPAPVLLSFLKALQSEIMIVTYEVILGIQRLINISGKDLSEPSWDILCDILIAIADNITFYDKTNCLPRDRILQNAFHETLTNIEKMLARNELATNPDTLYKVIEYVCEDRSELSVIQLMEYKASRISPTQPQWLQKLKNFMQRFFNMRNVNIRDKAIQVLRQIMEANRVAYEEEILERIVIPLFSNIPHETEVSVRTSVGKTLIEFASHCDTKRSLELFDIIEKLLNRPFDKFTEENRVILKNEDELLHICTIVDELIHVFISKLYHLPASHAIKIFHILSGHLERYYQKLSLLDSSVLIRNNIFSWMLKARANATYHLGYPDETKNLKIRYSHYISIDVGESGHRSNQTSQQSQQIPPPSTEAHPMLTSPEMMSTISIRRSCKIIIECLKNENEWTIIKLVLTELPNILQNKALLKGIEMDPLAATVISLHLSKARLETFISTTNKPVLSDFHALILPVIASLIPYHQYLNQSTQNRMICSLRPGLLSRSPHVCVHALTVMLLEMPELMLRNLPEILLEMSKMSTTLHVAVPVLEFLSTLNRVPSSRFANFVAVQYMYVFAISLPYTNPHKYDHYTVSLAHHVIAGWFLKCRLPLRRNYVNYIIKGFETNVQMPFEELKKEDFSAVNEDSSNRKRSSSLTERGTKNRERPSLQHLRLKSDETSVYKFHMELAETCIDFLARHTHSSCSALPKRFPTTDFLLNNGQSLSWIVGHNIITITTSCCSSVPVKHGLCDRCLLACKVSGQQKGSSVNLSVEPTSPEALSSKTNDSDSQNKRYTKASLQHNSGLDSESTEVTSSNSSSTNPTPHLQQMDSSGKILRQPSNEGRFSSSSGSLEALSRRGSNPDTPEALESSTRRDVSGYPAYISPQQSTDRFRQTCACPCYGWAEICIRRPTGNMSFIMRIQNQISLDTFQGDFQLHDLISVFMPSLGGMDVFGDNPAPTDSNNSISESTINENSQKKHATIDLTDSKTMDDMEKELDIPQHNLANPMESTLHGTSLPSGPIDIPKSTHKHKLPSGSFSDGEAETEDDESNAVAFDENDTRSRNPVRRVNSSPEMSSNWRHPFLTQKNSSNAPPTSLSGSIVQVGGDEEIALDIEQQQKKKNYCKDMRVSCEAIPEEIADSTPPNQTNSIESKPEVLANRPINTTPNKTQPNDHPKAIIQPTLLPSASLPTSKGPLATSTTDALLPTNPSQLPRKQHSADDALQQKHEQNSNVTVGGNVSSGTTSAKVKMSIEVTKLTAKPPHSPAPLSPRLLAKSSGTSLLPTVGSNANDFQRGRSKTISVVQNIPQNRDSDNRDNPKWTYKNARSGISPSSIFLQLFNIGPNKVTERPIQIKPHNMKALTLLDLIPPFEIHKVGVLYVGRGQCNNEAEILRNRYGSLRYVEFLQNLGTLVSLKHARESNVFLDMETDGRDGNFTYIWQDDIIQVTFHVATLMPNKEHDPNCNEKKKNIGNDFVSIVYNESGEDYNINTIKGQFNYACVIVQPLELNSNKIFIKCKDEVNRFISSEPKIISDSSAPRYARQLALHANLASLVAQSLKTKNQSPYASNWLERLRQIKNLKAKILRENNANQGSSEHGNAPTGNTVSGNTSGNIGTNNNSKETQWLKEDFTQYT